MTYKCAEEFNIGDCFIPSGCTRIALIISRVSYIKLSKQDRAITSFLLLVNGKIIQYDMSNIEKHTVF